MTAVAPSVAASANPFAAPAVPAGGGLRVLSVDDTLVCRKLVEVVLTRDGHTVVSAEDGRDALAQMAEATEAFDVVLTDHHMPRLDGLGLVRALRLADFPGAIIVISAGLEPLAAQQYRGLGVRTILRKPVTIEQIRDAVNRARPA